MYARKKFYTIMGICISTFLFSIIIGYMVFSNIFGTPLKKQNNDINVQAETTNYPEDNVQQEDTEEPVEEYYVVKENGTKIGVYAHKKDNLEFLYNIDVNINALPEHDKELIKHGVVLYTKEELAHFEEDYTS